MPATVVVTGSIGPGVAITSKTFLDVLTFKVNAQNSVITLEFASGVFTDVQIPSATSIAATKSGNTWFISFT